MDNVYFPQLSSGAIVQYSFSKVRSARTVRNVMRDGSLISYPDFGAAQLSWDMTYTGLSQSDIAMLKACFDACTGPLQPLTFIDPTSNAFAWSADLSNSVWEKSALLKVSGSTNDPSGAFDGFTVVNNGQAAEELTQTIAIPSNYQYCFSVYVTSAQAGSLNLIRRGSGAEQMDTVSVDNTWTRVQSSGRLNDGGNTLIIGMNLTPGQSVTIYGPQLEAQAQSSPYRATTAVSGVYPKCYWATEEIAITADGPSSYSAQIFLETTL